MVQQHGAWCVLTVVGVVVHYVQAVDGWHSNGVLHLDMKPANVAIDTGGSVVVLDAGSARFAPDGRCPVTTPVGTPGFVAPELVEAGEGVATAACDVYSLGVTLRKAMRGWIAKAAPAATVSCGVVWRGCCRGFTRVRACVLAAVGGRSAGFGSGLCL